MVYNVRIVSYWQIMSGQEGWLCYHSFNDVFNCAEREEMLAPQVGGSASPRTDPSRTNHMQLAVRPKPFPPHRDTPCVVFFLCLWSSRRNAREGGWEMSNGSCSVDSESRCVFAATTPVLLQAVPS
eukprot:3601608-Amphidinium_carterae.1